VLAGGLLAAAVPTAGGADPTSTYLERAQALRSDNATLVARSSSVLLGLYSLDARIARAREQRNRLLRREEALRREQQATRLKLRLAERALRVSREQLAERLRLLYVRGELDTVSVLLGAESLDDALAGIEELNRTASLNESVIAQALAARTALRALTATLAEQRAAVRRMVASAAATAARLERTRAERAAYLASLAARRELNAGQISSLESAAAAAQARSAALAEDRLPAPSEPGEDASAPVAATPGTITVVASGYALSGRTATGLPVGWGVVAVDPSVIPLGTRMSIPGYGQGIAADIGGGVRGAAIDLWFPTHRQALAWGRRTVTITLH
jgi:3D (Asp-Asp-Asp) domain-containing protein